MEWIPRRIVPLFAGLRQAFCQERTYHRFLIVLVAAVLTVRSRTVSNVLRTVGRLGPGHASSYHRVFSKRRWSVWKLSRMLIAFILEHWVSEGAVPLAGDDTVDGHPGKKVYGKGCHRDAVRSTHSMTAYRWGHKWVVLAILVKFPFVHRPWALPVMVALYRSKSFDEKHGLRHRTPAELMRQMLAVLIHWFPDRKWQFVGDGGFGTHPLAHFCHRHRKRLTLVSKFYPDANLYDAPPPRRKQIGRPRKRGKKLPSPQEVVSKTKKFKRLTVSWYGGGERRVEVAHGTGHWFKGGVGLVPILWVYVRDLTGTHRDEYFFTTDLKLSLKRVIEAYTARWSIETTFQEMRAYLGLETTRGRTENTVLRMAPCLFGLYSVVALCYAALPQRGLHVAMIAWCGKNTVTFSDAMTTVRRWIWLQWVFKTYPNAEVLKNLPRDFQKTILYAMTQAA
jgi:hypothetical protein